MAESFDAAMTEEHLQEDQRREAAARIGVVEWHPPGFRTCQASLLEEHAQATTIEIQFDFTYMSHDRRGRQPFFERGSDMHEKGWKILHTYIPGIGRLRGTI